MKKTSLKEYCPTINVEKLWSIVGHEAREHYAKDKSGKAPVIDLVKHVSYGLSACVDSRSFFI